MNGSYIEILGAILDAIIRMGAQINKSGRLFLNFRYPSRAATGTDTGDAGSGDGYVKNWLNFLLVSNRYIYLFLKSFSVK